MRARRLGALGVTPLRRQLGLELGAPDRRPRALAGALGVRSASQLVRLASSAAWSSARRASRARAGTPPRGCAPPPEPPRPLQVVPGALLGLLALGQPGRELLALGASRQRGVGALPRQPAELARRGVEARAVDGDGDAGEPLGEPVEVVDDPRVGEQALGDRAGVAPGLDQVEQAAGAVLRRGARRLRRCRSPRSARGRRRSAPASRSRPSPTEPTIEARRRSPSTAETARSSPDPVSISPASASCSPSTAAAASLASTAASSPGAGPPGARMPSAPRRGARSCIWVAWRRAAPTRPRRAPAARGRPSPPLGAARPPQPRGAGARPPRRRRRRASRARPRARRSAPRSASRRARRRAPRAAAGAPRGRRAGPARPARGTPPGPERARWPRAPRRALAVAAPPLLSGREPLLDRRATRRAPPRSASRPSPAWRGPRRASPRRPSAAPAGRGGRRRRAPLAARSPGARARSCSSAASAWRFSGRRRERASRSTSSARSRLSCVRSSFSCARRRRLRCLPSPAASSISRRRSRGLRVDDRLDAALADDRVHLLAEAGVGERPRGRRRGGSARRSAGTRPRRCGRAGAAIEISENSLAARPSELSSTTSTSARARGRRPCRRRRSRPASTGRGPPSGLCSPSAQSTASVMFDLPEPFGPTITLTPGENVEPRAVGEGLEALEGDRLQVHRVGSGRRRLMLARRPDAIRLAVERLQRPLGGLLLGVLLAPPGAAAELARRRPSARPRSGGRAAGRPRRSTS